MKSSSIILALGLIAFALPASVHAAKDPDKKEAKKAAKAALSEYDKNGNGSIDGEEVAAIQKAFEADKTGPLKRFDLNADGKLDASEVAGIGGGKKDKKKKNAA